MDRDPLTELLAIQDAARDTRDLRHGWADDLRGRRDDAERAVRDSLARIGAVVAALDAWLTVPYPGDGVPEEDEPVIDAMHELTDADRHLLGLDG